MVTINGNPVCAYGAKACDHYEIGGAEIDPAVFEGRYRTHFVMLANVPASRRLKLEIFFQGASRQDITLNKSRFDAAVLDLVEIGLPEGNYSAYCTDLGALVMQGNDAGGYIGTAEYEFRGFLHADAVTVTGNTVNCVSTIPRTDCKLECTVSVDADEYQLGTVFFGNVRSGDVLTADGITGRLLVNGAPATGGLRFYSFPYLVPGTNNIVSADRPTVTYYPTYI